MVHAITLITAFEPSAVDQFWIAGVSSPVIFAHLGKHQPFCHSTDAEKKLFPRSGRFVL
jgi:hypothetical protein